LNCVVCEGESFRGHDVVSCEGCVAERMLRDKLLNIETARKFCDCFANGHDKNAKTSLKPLSKKIQSVQSTLKKRKEYSNGQPREKITST